MSFGNSASNKSPNPYQVKLAPGFDRDPSGKMAVAFEKLRREQEARNTQHDEVIGNLETLSSDFSQLFMTITNIRNKMNNTLREPGIRKIHIKTLRIIIKLTEKVNEIIVNKIIPLIDELGKSNGKDKQ